MCRVWLVEAERCEQSWSRSRRGGRRTLGWGQPGCWAVHLAALSLPGSQRGQAPDPDPGEDKLPPGCPAPLQGCLGLYSGWRPGPFQTLRLSPTSPTATVSS